MRARIRLGVMASLICALGASGIAPVREVFEQKGVMERQKRQLAKLQEDNRALRSRLSRVNDPGYMEKLVREQLGLVRPGETVYLVVPGSREEPGQN
ncbi:MAG: FtsB family cell division protein [Actinomycetota bacterium]